MTSYRATVRSILKLNRNSVCVRACMRVCVHGVSVYGLNKTVHNTILTTMTLTSLQNYIQ